MLGKLETATQPCPYYARMLVTLTEKVRFLEGVFGRGGTDRGSKNFDVRCPLCADRAAQNGTTLDPSKKKLSILLETTSFHCWSCGAKGHSLWYLIKKCGTREQLLEYRDRFMPEDARSSCSFADDVPPLPKLELPNDFKLIVNSSCVDGDTFAIRKYLFDRGVSERDQWFYKVGHSNQSVWKRRVIIPSFDASGELNLYVGRSIDKDRKPKVMMPVGDRTNVIFNEINVDWTRRLVLCEGPFDYMKCGDNAVPMLGSDLNESGALFNSIIAHGTPIALAMDADMKATQMPRVAKKLAEYNVDLLIVDVPTDPGDCSKQEFKDLLAAAQPFDWRQTFLDQLERASHVSL